MSARFTLGSLAFLAALALPLRGEEKKASAFDKFKHLEGEWVGKEVSGAKDIHGDVNIKYKLTAAGSAVIETIMPGSEHEMVTVIHPDGKNLVLTHYCVLGNQPRMKAPGTADGNSVAFKFESATNLKSDKDFYMHDVTYTFVDNDTIKTEWTHFKDGAAAGKAVFELKRKK